MKKIYLKYPYLKEINANIVNRQMIDNKLHIICDKTIFIPRHADNEYYDNGTINGIKVLDVYSKNNNIYHVLESKPSTSKLQMKINWENRYEYMKKTTAKYIINSYLDILYSIQPVNVNLVENCIDIPIQKNLDDFKLKINNILSLTDNIICSALNVHTQADNLLNEKEDEYLKIKISNLNIKKDYNPHISNTSELNTILITDIVNIDDYTRIYFKTGNNALNIMKNIYDKASDISSNNNVKIENFNEYIDDSLKKLENISIERDAFKERLIESLAKIVNFSSESIIEITDEISLYDMSRYIIKDNYTLYRKQSNKILFLSKNNKINLKKFFEKQKIVIIGSGSNLVYRGEIDNKDSDYFFRKLNELNNKH